MTEAQITAFLKANPDVARKAMEGAVAAAVPEAGQAAGAAAAAASSADVVPEWGASSSKPAVGSGGGGGGGGMFSLFGLGKKKAGAPADDAGSSSGNGYAPPKVPAFTGSTGGASAPSLSVPSDADSSNPFTNVPLGGPSTASPRPASQSAAPALASPRPAPVPAAAPKPPAEDFEDNPFAS